MPGRKSNKIKYLPTPQRIKECLEQLERQRLGYGLAYAELENTKRSGKKVHENLMSIVRTMKEIELIASHRKKRTGLIEQRQILEVHEALSRAYRYVTSHDGDYKLVFNWLQAEVPAQLKSLGIGLKQKQFFIRTKAQIRAREKGKKILGPVGTSRIAIAQAIGCGEKQIEKIVKEAKKHRRRMTAISLLHRPSPKVELSTEEQAEFARIIKARHKG